MQRIHHNNGIISYTFDIFDGLPLSVHISTRHGGVSPAPWNSLNFSIKRGDTRARVFANRMRLAKALELDAGTFVACQQVHGRKVVCVDAAQAGQVQDGADGMVTDASMLPLSLVFADCVPVVLYDSRLDLLGVCHAGWRGTVLKTAVSTLDRLTQVYGTRPADVLAAIGPSIGPESYEVGQEVTTEALRHMSQADRLFVYRNGSDQNPHFDLWEANRSQLVEAGVPVEQIEVSGIDTATNTDDFFSHRAEHGRCGLFSMVSWLHA